ncbi:MAG TPA: 4-carboxy-4-hydroxy-2-oxoadipate aldolase/oxaloacetate decarboxylase [Terricaulis sp.]|nr:4-carboxy-4-hydroxy-2-oxoadipate aldolase/oxaloacetate decarboxylase [Terricaulis sp.]
MSADRFDPALTTRVDFKRPDAALLTRASGLSSPTVHEAYGRKGALPPEIKPVAPSFKICGPALTVHSPGGDNLWLHRAIALAQPGDVLVVYVSGVFDYGYWGEIMSTGAASRGLGGLVIDGGVRDGALLEGVGLPVFSRGLCIRGTGKDVGARGWLGAPLLFGDTIVRAGDLIIGDGDGVVSVRAEDIAEVIEASRQRDEREAAIMQRLREGETTLGIYNLG